MFNFNGTQYKRSGRAGGKSVPMVGMLVLLLAALLILPSCTGDTRTVTETVPGDPVTVPGDPVTVPVPGPTTYICPDEDMTTVPDPADCPPSAEEMCDEGDDQANTLPGGFSDDYICGLGGDDIITGGAGNDTLEGGAGNDTLRGGAGDDVLKGGDDDDKLYTGAGNDRAYGGDGDDELIVQGGNNMLNGGGDTDIAIYLETGGVSANLLSGDARHLATVSQTDPFGAPGGGNDMLAGIENIKGSHKLDILIGNAEDNLLKGLDGADTISGGDGNDTIIPNRPMAPAEIADGSALAEGEVVVSDGIDTVNGGDGMDTVSYEGEAATHTADGTDVAVFALTINLAASATNLVAAVEDNPATTADESVPAHITATLDNGDGSPVVDRIVVENKGTKDEPRWVSTIENVVGGGGADTITGDARNNVLTGGPGVDVIDGGLGNDTVHADGADTDLDGGTGLLAEDNEDTVDVDESTAGDKDILSYAGVKEDTDTTNNTPTPTPDGVTVTIATDAGGAGIRGFEEVVGSPLNDTFTASSEGGVTIMGGGGVDTLTGAAGKDTLMGGAGNDTITGDAEADTLNGGPGEDSLTGGAGGDVFVLSAGEGPDTIIDYTPDEDGEHVQLKGFTTRTATVALSDTSTVVIMVGGDVVFKLTTATAVTLNDIVADLKKTGSIVFVD